MTASLSPPVPGFCANACNGEYTAVPRAAADPVFNTSSWSTSSSKNFILIGHHKHVVHGNGKRAVRLRADDESGPSGGVCAIPTSSCVSVSTGLGGDTTFAAALRFPLLPEAPALRRRRTGVQMGRREYV